MLRRIPAHSVSTQSVRKGSAAVAVVATTCIFAVLLGVVYFVAGRHSDQPQRPDVNNVAADHRTSDLLEINVPAEPSAKTAVVETAAVDSEPVVEPKPVESKPAEPIETAATRLEEVKAQLAAGEFGPALETTRAVADAKERGLLLRQIADAQLEAGEFEAAAASIRRIPIPKDRYQARRRRTSKQILAGGGTGANFQQLMDLIRAGTTGPWDEEGAGGDLDVDEDGPSMTPFDNSTGVLVNPNGLLFKLSRAEQTGRLKALGHKARVADLNDDMARSSSLRLVSLTRLEKEISKRLAEGKPVLETMKHLAGLSQIKHVFVYPEEGEIVIGGPAEGWQFNEAGLPVGIENGRPTLQLDDFVTVFRTFSPDGRGIFNCRIVPRSEGLMSAKEFSDQSSARGSISPSKVRKWTKKLERKLGLQDIEVNGIPADSRVARVIVEADYRMKLIGINKLHAGKSIPSFFDLLPKELQKNPPTNNALRWWLTMKYDSVLHSPEHNAFEIVGPSVLCLSENEKITAEGRRVSTGKAEPTNRRFAEKFTKGYAELAQRDLVFADLQNIFDLALVAALVSQERLDERIEWDRGTFAAGGAYRPARFDSAKTVMSVVNHRIYNRRDIIIQVAGGVRADLMSVVRDKSVYQESPRLDSVRNRGRAGKLPEGRWWWDAAE